LSLDFTGPKAVRETSICSPLPAAIDVEAVTAHLGFDADEAAFFEATAIDGLSWTQAVERLQWTLRRGEAVRKRVARRLKRIRRAAPFNVGEYVQNGSSLHLAFVQRLANGRSSWTLAELGRGFLDIMSRERIDLFPTKRPRKSG